ncbi:hypothetical protein [Bradyrhizobium sp. LTSP885]|uniref:hypothetical protein n=1 Tax=Bradyrhizobium sp. LTSP885 TaxID=1619232 RepID=UPI001FDA4997|nr:hypothetical protein [Bradyrhizobium sp. LTSP885]
MTTDIRTFECPACDHVQQRVVELTDQILRKVSKTGQRCRAGRDPFASEHRGPPPRCFPQMAPALTSPRRGRFVLVVRSEIEIINFSKVSRTEQHPELQSSMLAPSPARSGTYPVTESSAALPPVPGRSTMFPSSRPPCAKCETRMMLARITPGPSGFDIRTFECPACDHVHQMTVGLVDPMKSLKANGWLHGQLQAPT